MRATEKSTGIAGMSRYNIPFKRLCGTLALFVALLALAPALALGYTWPSDDFTTVSRTIESNDEDVPLDEDIHVTWSVQLDEGGKLSNLFISEQLPFWIAVRNVEAYFGPTPLQVLYETGEVGEVADDLVPHRFIFDAPQGGPNFIMQQGGRIDLHFSIAAQSAGEVRLDFNGWFAGFEYGEYPDITSMGGYMENSPVLRFSDTPLVLQSLTVSDETDYLAVNWVLLLDGENQSFRLHRGVDDNPWHSAPILAAGGYGPGSYHYNDHDVLPGREYHYWIALLDDHNQPESYLGPIRGQIRIADRLVFAQNFPNPFNPTTNLAFTLHETGLIDLSIFDVQGRLIRNLASGEWLAGNHTLQWDGRDELGNDQVSGIYYARLLMSGHHSEIRKMTLIR
ncbi:MAG: hypothetical protein GY835_15610 [bacterium]|nr:hypothetical protein [bacterium]